MSGEYLTALQRIAVALETLAATASAAPQGAKVADAKAANTRAAKEAEHAPEMDDDEFRRMIAKIETAKVYKPETLAKKLGSAKAGNRVAYWLQRRGFWKFDRTKWGYKKI